MVLIKFSRLTAVYVALALYAWIHETHVAYCIRTKCRDVFVSIYARIIEISCRKLVHIMFESWTLIQSVATQWQESPFASILSILFFSSPKKNLHNFIFLFSLLRRSWSRYSITRNSLREHWPSLDLPRIGRLAWVPFDLFALEPFLFSWFSTLLQASSSVPPKISAKQGKFLHQRDSVSVEISMANKIITTERDYYHAACEYNEILFALNQHHHWNIL